MRIKLTTAKVIMMYKKLLLLNPKNDDSIKSLEKLEQK
jgi:hypothetical protein